MIVETSHENSDPNNGVCYFYKPLSIEEMLTDGKQFLIKYKDFKKYVTTFKAKIKLTIERTIKDKIVLIENYNFDYDGTVYDQHILTRNNIKIKNYEIYKVIINKGQYNKITDELQVMDICYYKDEFLTDITICNFIKDETYRSLKIKSYSDSIGCTLQETFCCDYKIYKVVRLLKDEIKDIVYFKEVDTVTEIKIDKKEFDSDPLNILYKLSCLKV